MERPDWPTCTKEKDCTGVRLWDGPCLAHAEPEKQDLAMAMLSAGANLDVTRGVTIDEELLSRILPATEPSSEGRRSATGPTSEGRRSATGPSSAGRRSATGPSSREPPLATGPSSREPPLATGPSSGERGLATGPSSEGPP